MTCQLDTLVSDIKAVYQVKYEQCCAGVSATNGYPASDTTLCGDGDGLIPEIIAATDALIANGCVYENPTFQKPDDPSECLHESEYLTDIRDWIANLTCDEPTCLEEFELTTSGGLFGIAGVVTNDLMPLGSGEVTWYEGEELFAAGDYTVSFNGLADASNIKPRYVQFFDSNGTTIFSTFINVTSSAGTDYPCFETVFDGVDTFKVEAVIVLEDCSGNQRLLSIHDSTEDSNCSDPQRSFTLNAPSKIGIGVRLYAEYNQNKLYGSLVFVDYGAEYELTPCPNPCSPRKVEELTYEYSGGVTAQLTWTDVDCCFDTHEVFISSVNSCGDCSDAVLALNGTTVDPPYPLSALQPGTYCVRVDTIRGTQRATGDVQCVEIGCVSDEKPEFVSSDPEPGGEFVRTSSESVVDLGVTWDFVAAIETYAKKIGESSYSLVRRWEDLDDTTRTTRFGGYYYESYGDYSLYSVGFDRCGNAIISETVSFRISASQTVKKWISTTSCQYANDPFGSTFCIDLADIKARYTNASAWRWLKCTNSTTFIGTIKSGSSFTGTACATAPGTGANGVIFQVYT